MSLNQRDVDFIYPIFHKALQDACHSLGMMLNREILLSPPDIKLITTDDLNYIYGNNKKIISATYMEYEAQSVNKKNDFSLDGRILLSFKIESAYEMATILTEDLDVPLDQISEITNSVFSEIGNVFSTSFLTAMANAGFLRLLPSTPVVINYKINSILDYLCSKIPSKDHQILLMQANLHSDGNVTEGKFLLIPDHYKFIQSFAS